MTAPELKPCPFCGGAAVKGYNSGAVTHIYCIDCRAGTRYQDSEQDALDSWNTRAPQPQSGDRAKALAALDELHSAAQLHANCDDNNSKYYYQAYETIRAALTQPEFEVVDDETEAFISDVRKELTRARQKFPGDRIMTIALAEEFGELCKAVLDENSDRVRKEAVQTAVMAARVALDGDGSVTEWRNERGLDQIVRKKGGE